LVAARVGTDAAVEGSAVAEFVYVQMGPAVTLGFIQPPAPGLWHGTLVTPRHAFVGDTMAEPEGFLRFYFDRAAAGRGVLTACPPDRKEDH
jgi:hypothetical protein